MVVLVTGGAGFIGSAVVRQLVRETDDKVVNLDKLTYAGNLRSLDDLRGDARHVFVVEHLREVEQPTGQPRGARVDHVAPHQARRRLCRHRPPASMSRSTGRPRGRSARRN